MEIDEVNARMKQTAELTAAAAETSRDCYRKLAEQAEAMRRAAAQMVELIDDVGVSNLRPLMLQAPEKHEKPAGLGERLRALGDAKVG